MDRSDGELDGRLIETEAEIGDPDAPTMVAELGKYRVRRAIGMGGMGVVLAAHDPELGRDVAIKLLSSDGDEARARLLREAQAMARLKHPNVVTVFDAIRAGDRTGIVMELVDGETLGAWQAARPRGWREILAAYLQAARGLAAAHRAGLVHRDFKPANALIDGDGVVRVTDFGLVHMAGDVAAAFAPPPGPDGAGDSHLTTTGRVMGTPAYMAPEQHRGAPVDARTDQWAFACALVEALAGERPFAGATPPEIAVEVTAGRMRPVPAGGGVPRGVWSALRRALSVDPADRFGSMDELIAALEPRRRPAFRLAAGGALVVAAVAIAALLAGRPPAAPVAAGPAPLVAVVARAHDEPAWLATAFAEMLTTELGAGERFRVVPSEAVSAAAQARGVTGGGDAAAIALGKALAVDHLLVCSLADGGRRIELRLIDVARGAPIASLAGDASEAALFDTVEKFARDLRGRLGRPPLSPAELTSAGGAHPRNLEAARAYAEGLDALRRYDAQKARRSFERAIALEPNIAKYHAALGAVWRALQFPARASEAATRAYELSEGLPRAERMFIEARHHHAARRYDRAGEIYGALATFFPENVEYTLALAEMQTEAGRAKDALATLDRLRAGAAPEALDARADLLEADAARIVGDSARAERAVAAARDRAQKLGAAELEVRAGAVACLLPSKDFERRIRECGAVAEMALALGERGLAARALLSVAYAQDRRKELDAAFATLARARALYEEIGNQRGVAQVLDRLGMVLTSAGRPEEARVALEEALVRAREAGDPSAEARAYVGIANAALEGRRPAAAREAYARSIDLSRQIGSEAQLAIALQNLAWLEGNAGNVVSARHRAEEAMAIQERLGREVDLAYSLDCVAVQAMSQDDLAAAEPLLLRALGLRERMKTSVVPTLQNLAELRLGQRRLAEARELIERALAASGGGVEEAFAREVQARVLLEIGDLDGADRAVARARELGAKRGESIVDADAARILTERGRPRAAMALALRARERAEQDGELTMVINAEGTLGEAELAAGLRAGDERLARAANDAAARGFAAMARQFQEIRARLLARRAVTAR